MRNGAKIGAIWFGPYLPAVGLVKSAVWSAAEHPPCHCVMSKPSGGGWGAKGWSMYVCVGEGERDIACLSL